MLSVPTAYEDASEQTVRRPTAKTLISWDRQFDDTIDIFTIGTSLIGGDDIIGGTPDVILYWDQFVYTDESDYLMSVEIEREQTEPIFSVSRSMLDVTLDNTSGRFTPQGGSAIDDFILPRRPIRSYIGFNNVSYSAQLFIGELVDYPEISTENRLVTLHARDFMERIWNYPLEETQMYVDTRSDELILALLEQFGLNEDQTNLDVGLNVIGFAYFEKGDKLGPILQKICEAELAWFYLDENGVVTFENRAGWLSRTSSVLTIGDDIVFSEKIPARSNVINVAEIFAKPREVRPEQPVWSLDSYVEIPSGETELFVDYDDPMFSVTEPTAGGATSLFLITAANDGSGQDYSSQITVDWTDFAKSSKAVFTNNLGFSVYLVQLDVWGQPAKVIGADGKGIYFRYQDDTSVEAYDEQPAKIENDFIQDETFAQTIATILVEDRKDPGNYRELTIQGRPQLQIGDLVTRGGVDYNIQRIRTRLTKSEGLVQDLTLVQRTIQPYFRIGISTIGGDDVIAP